MWTRTPAACCFCAPLEVRPWRLYDAGEPEVARAQQEAEREPAHEGAPGLEGATLEPAVEGGLQGERHPEEGRGGRRVDPEAEGDLAEGE